MKGGLNSMFRQTTKKTKHGIMRTVRGESIGHRWISSQRADDTESDSISWRDSTIRRMIHARSNIISVMKGPTHSYITHSNA